MNINDLDLLDQFEVGGSFFELIEFSLVRKLSNGQEMKGIYGVNVAKVREVVHMPKINPLASRLPGVAGIFELRGVPIPAINLCQILGDADASVSSDQQIIVTEFSAKRAGFIVASTHRIRKVAWDNVMPPSSDQNSCMTGMVLIEDNEFLFILDLEKILNDIEIKNGTGGSFSPYTATGPSGGGEGHGIQPASSGVLTKKATGPGVLFVDDSKLVLNNVSKILSENNYRVLTAENGLVAFELLKSLADGEHKDFGPIHCVITDVEMPLMDGITLIKKIKEDPNLQELPVLMHTSLSGDVTLNAAQSVGASGYIVKNDTRSLCSILANVLKGHTFALGG